MTMLCCNDCQVSFLEDDLLVKFPEIPNLMERITPGEPVPHGECPKCGALAHVAEPDPNRMAYLAVRKGKFQVTLDGVDGKTFAQRDPDIVSDDPEKVREFVQAQMIGNLMCSSSVDFPEESGMLRETVDILFKREIMPGDYHEPQEKCPKCGAEDIKTIEDKEDPHYYDDDETLLRECRGCSLRWHEHNYRDEEDADG
jgi:predicted RNA-binding Zn-ribbon protein involved in translation (DUF1610 family)